jgi:hypothetical protein
MARVVPRLTGRKLWDTAIAGCAFPASIVGMGAMTGAFAAAASMAQLNLERRMGLDFPEAHRLPDREEGSEESRSDPDFTAKNFASLFPAQTGAACPK